MMMEQEQSEYYKQTLRPNNFRKPQSPKEAQKAKTKTASKSKDKQIVTSFSKKTINPPLSPRNQPLTSTSLKQCQSQYYIKTNTTQRGNQPVTERKLSNDDAKIKQRQIESLSVRLAQAELTINHLQAANKLKQTEITRLNIQKEVILGKAMKQYGNQLNVTDMAFEIQKLKLQQERLLKILQSTAEYKYFAQFGLMDGGVDFLQYANTHKKSQVDAFRKGNTHFCACNREFIQQNLFWVPKQAGKLAKQFIVQRNGRLTESEIQLLLYELNRVWREREKKIVNRMGNQKGKRQGVDSMQPKTVK